MLGGIFGSNYDIVFFQEKTFFLISINKRRKMIAEFLLNQDVTYRMLPLLEFISHNGIKKG